MEIIDSDMEDLSQPIFNKKIPSSHLGQVKLTISSSSAIYILLPYLSNLEIVLMQGLSKKFY
jgi:hypothetical protein